MKGRMHDIDKYLKRAILNSHLDDAAKKDTSKMKMRRASTCRFMLTINKEIKCVYRINFIKSSNIAIRIAIRIFIESYTGAVTVA